MSAIDSIDARINSIRPRIDSIRARINSILAIVDSILARIGSILSVVNSITPRIASIASSIDSIVHRGKSKRRAVVSRAPSPCRIAEWTRGKSPSFSSDRAPAPSCTRPCGFVNAASCSGRRRSRRPPTFGACRTPPCRGFPRWPSSWKAHSCRTTRECTRGKTKRHHDDRAPCP